MESTKDKDDKDTNVVDEYILQANLYLQDGPRQNIYGAIILLVEVYKTNPSHIAAHILLYEAYLKQRKHRTALSYNSRVLELRPDCHLICKQAGEVNELLGDYPKAINFYQKIDELSKNHGQCDACSFVTTHQQIDVKYLTLRITLKMNLKKLTQRLSDLMEKSKRYRALQSTKSQSNDNRLPSELGRDECISLGKYFRDQMNYVKARKYFANVENSPEADLNLGMLKFMGKGGEEDLSGGFQLIFKAAHNSLYDETNQGLNRSGYESRCIIDILAKEGLGEFSDFKLLKDWIKRDDSGTEQCSSSTLPKTMDSDTAQNINLPESATHEEFKTETSTVPLTPEIYFQNAIETQLVEKFTESLMLLEIASQFGYCKDEITFRKKIVNCKIVISEFVKRLPLIGDCNVFFNSNSKVSDFFSCFTNNLNLNGEHQVAVKNYKDAVREKIENSLVIVVAEFLLGNDKEIEDTVNLVEEIFSLSSNVNENAAYYFLHIEAKRILEIIEEFRLYFSK